MSFKPVTNASKDCGSFFDKHVVFFGQVGSQKKKQDAEMDPFLGNDGDGRVLLVVWNVMQRNYRESKGSKACPINLI